VEFVNIGSELTGAERGYIALWVDVECWVVSLIGEEGGYTG
jgi:hypothetical protein